jgi:hypothetical protein
VKHADGRVEFVHLRGTTVVCEDLSTGRTPRSVDAGHALLYLRAAADAAGRVAAGGQSHDDGVARVAIDGGSVVDLGVAPFPFGVLLHGDENGWTVFIQRTSTSYDEVWLGRDGNRLGHVRHTMPPTSQGFLYVGADGTPVTQDAGRNVIFGLALPSPAGDAWVGQSLTAATLALFDPEAGHVIPLNTPGGQPPHIVESGGTYFVCTYVDGGSWLSTHRKPFDAVTPPPVEPPPVHPDPPQETPVQLEPKHSQVIQSFADQFGLPGFSKEEGQAWVAKLASTMKARFPGEGWGTKRASMGRPLSNESIARPANGRLWGYDLIIGAGAPGQRLEPRAHAEDITDQVFVEVESRDWLGNSVPTPGPSPNPTPPPAARPFPAFRVPEDIFLSAYTTYIGGLYARDQIDEPGGWKVASRGATMWFVPIFYEKIIALIAKKGNQLPTPNEWWDLASEGAAAAIDFYRRTAPPE